MSQLDQYVNASADDWTIGDPASTSANTLTVRDLNGATVSTGYCLIDTSSIPDDATIDSATFYWYDHSYGLGGGDTVDSKIWIYDSGVDYIEIYAFTSFTAGAKSHALEASELQYISKTGNTRFQFTTTYKKNNDRTWDIRAYDGYSGSNEQPRLVVNYTEASSGIQKTQIIGC